ncbi:hypothetical protein LC087_13245 [Bacillus carboniphilus]|uniref:Uncharacterized protein n=1 Tax=Bacillus carboniphilus TaxID=86663 RepID=A0ABY9JTP5_9BACI|nr:hypothetical protein [Bacillus carboniphilus]WLR41805.1 hypothetical protein LC087_13245 [Bacillus carboniphilus]
MKKLDIFDGLILLFFVYYFFARVDYANITTFNILIFILGLVWFTTVAVTYYLRKKGKITNPKKPD